VVLDECAGLHHVEGRWVGLILGPRELHGGHDLRVSGTRKAALQELLLDHELIARRLQAVLRDAVGPDRAQQVGAAVLAEAEMGHRRSGFAKLVGGVAVIKVGAATETEMKEKKARVEDAMHATRAAVEEGIVPGGGVAFIRAFPALDKLKLDGDEQIGVNIVKRALEEPLRLIASNAGHEGAIVIGKVRESAKANYGFNAETEEYTDMIAAGILDPAKVTRSALQNAASIASLMLTTEAMIVELPGREAAPAMPGGGGNDMY